MKEIYLELCALIEDDAICDIHLPTYGTTLLEQLEGVKGKIADYIARNIEETK